VDLPSLIDTYCAAWSAESPEQRRKLLLSVWADGATYTDPTVHFESAEALLDHIAGVRASVPGARIVRSGDVDSHHGMARFAWNFLRPDGSTLATGLDIVFLSADEQRLTRIVGFFNAP
jgi:hypothetical protein